MIDERTAQQDASIGTLLPASYFVFNLNTALASALFMATECNSYLNTNSNRPALQTKNSQPLTQILWLFIA